jgi:PilZ domain
MRSALHEVIVSNLCSPNRVGSMQSTRRYERMNVALPVRLCQVKTQVPVWARTADICLGGCYVGLSFTLEVSAQVDVTIWIGEAKVHAAAEIVSHHPGFGNGMKFTHMSLEDQQKLEIFLHTLTPLRPLAMRAQSAASSS